MIIGLDKFREHFVDYQNQYLLIGGAAAWLLLDDAGLDARATKDLDIVLAIEVLDPRFAVAFWDFVVAGDYEICQKSTGERTFYRFAKPKVAGYPVMLELFSRVPDEFELGDGAKLTPIPVSEDVSSLSAILHDAAYYEFLQQHRQVLDGITLVSERCLIPLKAKAWLDLSARKGESGVDSRDIKKHRSDILRLYQLLQPGERVELSGTVQADVEEFLLQIESEVSAGMLKSLGIQCVSPEDVFVQLRSTYGIQSG